MKNLYCLNHILTFFAVITYRIIVVPTKRGTTTSANVWIVLSGTLSETKRIAVEKGSLSMQIKVKSIIK